MRGLGCLNVVMRDLVISAFGFFWVCWTAQVLEMVRMTPCLSREGVPGTVKRRLTGQLITLMLRPGETSWVRRSAWRGGTKCTTTPGAWKLLAYVKYQRNLVLYWAETLLISPDVPHFSHGYRSGLLWQKKLAEVKSHSTSVRWWIGVADSVSLLGCV